MNKLLRINTSIFETGAQSTRLADEVVAHLERAHPGLSVEVLDLATDPVAHLDAATFGAFIAAPEQRTAEQQAAVARSDRLIAQLREADAIVLGLPMYNFGVPSTLKAYFDHVARAGETFRYTENGPVGLLNSRPVYIAAARGGQYLGTPRDTQTRYVQDFLAFIGLDDARFVYAEGLALGNEQRDAALEKARGEIAQIAA